MDNLESQIKKHKIKMFSWGAGSAFFGLVGGVLTYDFIDILNKNYLANAQISELLPSLSEQSTFGDLMVANAVALGLAYGLFGYAMENYEKIKELKRRRKVN